MGDQGDQGDQEKNPKEPYYGEEENQEPHYGEEEPPDDTTGATTGEQAQMRPTGSGGSAPPA